MLSSGISILYQGIHRTIVLSWTFCASNKSARECDVKGSEKQSVVLQ